MTDHQPQDAASKKNILARFWDHLKRPSVRYSLGSLLTIGFIVGILFGASFNWAMEMTNTETFCISCHEMKENVYREYQDTIHYYNGSGVRATCPDCHVPKQWIHKVVRKIQAANDVYHHMMGSIDTPEKFEAKRLELAKRVWDRMKANDSRECRSCHDNEAMDYTKQGRRAVPQHIKGADEGKTCIDCHKGIAHSLPALNEIDPSAAMGGH
jgi:cytochrome c-type protein NapC